LSRREPLGGSQRGRHVAGVEGLRAVAAGTILVYHVWLYTWLYDTAQRPPDLGFASDLLPHLALGVTLFFALSGFLLYRPFAQAILDGTAAPAMRRYARNRVLRIVPAYWVVFLAAGVLGSLLVHTPSGLRAGGFTTDPVLLPLGLALAQNYQPAHLLSGVGPTWSLAVEVVFYVALPFVAMIGVRVAQGSVTHTRRRVAALAPAIVVLVAGTAGKLSAWQLHSGSGSDARSWLDVLDKSFLTHADLFAFGMALAVVAAEVDAGRLTVARAWRRGIAVSAAVTMLVVTQVGTPELFHRGALTHYLYGSAAGLACALVLALVVLPSSRGIPGAGARMLDARPLYGVGLVSYSVFLWHEPLLVLLRRHGLLATGRDGFALNLVTIATATMALAALTYRYVEAPALRRKARPPAADITAPVRMARSN
jgi:peptidoglycan/LPS O-acetylase OafA/YrhL